MKTVEISTSQNVIVQYELGSTISRAVAFVIDLVIIILAAMLLTTALDFVVRGSFFSTYLWLPFCFYTLLFESLNKGRTPGKMLMKLRVMRIDGKEMQFTDYFMRWMMRIIDLYGTVGGLAVFSSLSSDKNQRMGDFLSNTVVVNIKKYDRLKLNHMLKFDSLSDYKVRFPQVVAFEESEMLLVKEVLKRYKAYPNKAHQMALNSTCQVVSQRMKIDAPDNELAFLNTLIKDYVVLTR